MNLETEVVNQARFVKTSTELFRKAVKKKVLDRRIKQCKLCPGLNILGMTESAPGYGNLQADIFFVGQSLCTACMGTQIPFTRGGGYLLDAALLLVDLERKDVFMSNVLHCHPPNNRTSELYEIKHCKHFLIEEIELVQPQLVVVLGNDAARVLKSSSVVLPLKNRVVSKFLYVKHPAYWLRKGGRGSKDWIIKVAMEIDKIL